MNHRLLLVATVLASLWFSGAFLFIALSRLFYPFELEWMEGAIVDHGARVAQGYTLYGPPSVDFIPFIYPPLYAWLLGAGYAVFDVNLWWGRAVSIVGTLCAAGISYRWVWVETKSHVLAFLAAGLFLASFRMTGAWFDLNRVDMLRLALLAGGMYLLRGSTAWHLAASAALLATAFFAKQFALVFLVAGACVAFLRGARSGVIFSTVGFGLLSVGVVALLAASDGWYWHYCFEVPFRNGLVWDLVQTTWRQDILYRFPFLLGASAAVGIAWWSTARERSLRALPVVFVAAGCGTAASFFARIHVGGYDNTLIPLAYFVPIFFAVGLGRLGAALPEPTLRRGIVGGFLAVGLFQFYGYHYAYARQIPTPEDVERGNEFLSAIRKLPGDVLIPFHGYYWSQTGKQMRFHMIGLHDEITSRRANEQGREVIVPDYDLVPEDIAASFRERHFSVVLPDSQYYMDVLGPILREHYRPDPALVASQGYQRFPTLPPPRTGMIVVPTGPWTPIADPLPRQ